MDLGFFLCRCGCFFDVKRQVWIGKTGDPGCRGTYPDPVITKDLTQFDDMVSKIEAKLNSNEIIIFSCPCHGQKHLRGSVGFGGDLGFPIDPHQMEYLKVKAEFFAFEASLFERKDLPSVPICLECEKYKGIKGPKGGVWVKDFHRDVLIKANEDFLELTLERISKWLSFVDRK